MVVKPTGGTRPIFGSAFFFPVCYMDTSLADNIMGLGSEFETWLLDDPSIGYVLIACLGIAVGFVAYKLIKRALNKA